MKIHKLYIVIGLIIAFVVFFELSAHADEMSESTKITFSAPVQVSGHLLPAGTYIFEQLDAGNSDPNAIQIFSADRRTFYAMVQTVSAERLNATDQSVITVAEPGNGEPAVLLKWFYPGHLEGHQFVYSRQQFGGYNQKTFVGSESKASGSASVE